MFKHIAGDKFKLDFKFKGDLKEVEGVGNGPLDACLDALKNAGFPRKLSHYKQYALDEDKMGSGATAMSVIKLVGKNGEEIITELDKRLLSIARKIWPLSEYESEQIVALFKLLYLMNDGAAKWGDIIFYDKTIPEDLYKIMASHNMSQAPNYALSQMQPQKIEPAIPQHWFKRLLRFSLKKAS